MVKDNVVKLLATINTADHIHAAAIVVVHRVSSQIRVGEKLYRVVQADNTKTPTPSM
jgi:hypothetical protein